MVLVWGWTSISECTYRLSRNPAENSKIYPWLVLDGRGRLHLPLTVFAGEAAAQVASKTAQQYLTATLPFFSFLEADEQQRGTGRHWDDDPVAVRFAVSDYLVQRCHCQVRPHRRGFQLVASTKGSQSTVRGFLSALKLFYEVAREQGFYGFQNPLRNPVSVAAPDVEPPSDEYDERVPWPRMPVLSGVQSPSSQKRLSDSYFKLVGGEWIPRIVDDPTLPGRVLTGGRHVKGWGLRQECITRILFESGARVSEVVGLTLSDWAARGLLQEATSFSKGSRGRRIKFLRFSSETAKLLRRYFDGERRSMDSNGYGVAEYQRDARSGQADLLAVPLFLSARRLPLNTKTFRDLYWNPACRAAGIDADIHQARHWYVTMAMRQIYETARDAADVQRRKRQLVVYMGWKGDETLAVYEHYFDVARHAEIQVAVHAKLDAAVDLVLNERMLGRTDVPRGRTAADGSAPLLADDLEFDFLRQLGGGDGSTAAR